MAPLVPPPQRPRFNIFDFTQAIDSPYRLRKSFEAAQITAFFLAGWFILSGLIVWYDERRVSWLSSAEGLALVHAVSALISVYLGVVIRRRAPEWALWLVLGIAVMEATRFVPVWLYAGRMPTALAILAIIGAVQGVRAARARRRIAEEPNSAQQPTV